MITEMSANGTWFLLIVKNVALHIQKLSP